MRYQDYLLLRWAKYPYERTRDFVRKHGQLEALAAVAGVVPGALFALGENPSVLDRMAGAIVGGAGVFLTLLGFVFLFNLASTPFQLTAEATRGRDAAQEKIARREASSSRLQLLPELEPLKTKIGLEEFVIGYLVRVRVTNTSKTRRRFEAKGHWADELGRKEEANWFACWELSQLGERERSVSPATPQYVHVAQVMLAERREKLDDPDKYIFDVKRDDDVVFFFCRLCDGCWSEKQDTIRSHVMREHSNVPKWEVDGARVKPLKPSPPDAYENWGNGKFLSISGLIELVVEDLDEDTAPSRILVGFRDGKAGLPEVFEYDIEKYDKMAEFQIQIEEHRAKSAD